MAKRWIGTVGLVLVLGAAACGTDRGPRTITDTGFVDAANALCQRELPALRAERRESDFFGRTDKSDRADVADRVEQVADRLDDVAGKLGGLPLAAADQGEVSAWLEEWANYTGIGRKYAEAVRSEKASVYSDIATEGNASVRRIADFARANRIDRCVL